MNRTRSEKRKMARSGSSRLPGWHRLSRKERCQRVAAWLGMDRRDLFATLDGGGLSFNTAQQLVENVIGLHSLPFSVAPNFIINGRETLIPMVIEEPSVVAAAANAARIARAGGGFQAVAADPIMICQIQLFVDDFDRARSRILDEKQALISIAALKDQKLVDLGGGPVDLVVRTLHGEDGGRGFLVVHLLVCVLDAMGANTVNTMGEALVQRLEEITGGRAGLRILSNLADLRLVTARVKIPLEALRARNFEPLAVRDGIVSASQFAELDPYRAATHNKGIMNGVDAVMLATGNDWRAVEAGAHAFAARDGRYRPLCTWRAAAEGDLLGKLEMPMAVGVVGGATRIHQGARLALRIMGAKTAADLACISAAVGMANNLAALRALATEGIQEGHMRLHLKSRWLAGED